MKTTSRCDSPQTSLPMEASVRNSEQSKLNPMKEPAGIRGFYGGRAVLVTGATGFLGKALVEKLLRSCPDVRKIFLVIRPKRGLDVPARFNEFVHNPVFDTVRAECPDQLSKLHPVSGDVLRPNLGLSEDDLAVLVREVGVVFHTAATVRFNEPLQLAVLMNTQGTRRVVDLCREIGELTAFVHVSTAYSNPGQREVLEQVYPPPADPDTVVQFVTNTAPDILSDVEARLIGDHPNTYTFSKALAESVVLQEASSLPTAIVRPSIVTAAWREPVPGWLDSAAGGVTAMCTEIGRGTVRSVLSEGSCVMDVVPVDVVVNTLLAVAAHLHFHRPSHIPVFNCTSGERNPLRWGELNQLMLKAARTSPSKYVQWFPNCTFRPNRVVHRLAQLFLHTLVAFLLDVLLRVTGHKPIMTRICERTRRVARTGEFFGCREWAFEGAGLEGLRRNAAPEDVERFPMDMCAWRWDQYMHTYHLGIRKYVLKDDPSSLPAARRKLAKLYWGQRIVQGIAIIILLKFGISSLLNLC